MAEEPHLSENTLTVKLIGLVGGRSLALETLPEDRAGSSMRRATRSLLITPTRKHAAGDVSDSGMIAATAPLTVRSTRRAGVTVCS